MSHKPGQPRRKAPEVKLNPESKWDTPKEYAWPKRQPMTRKRALVVVGGIVIIVLGAVWWIMEAI